MFYDNFVRLCELKGEKPSPVAKKLGCTTSNVALWKKGSTPRPAVVQRFADYFGVTTQFLLFGDESGQKEKPAPEEAGFHPSLEEWLDAIDHMSREDMRAVMNNVMERYAREDK